MALLTVHHWTDLEAGIAELRRIARRRIVVLTWDQIVTRQFWLLSEYLPEAAAFDDTRAVPVDRLAALLGDARVEPVLVPHDCTDGFGAAYWRRPEAYLDPVVRAGMSMLAQPGDEVLRSGLDRLADDLGVRALARAARRPDGTGGIGRRLPAPHRRTVGPAFPARSGPGVATCDCPRKLADVVHVVGGHHLASRRPCDPQL